MKASDAINMQSEFLSGRERPWHETNSESRQKPLDSFAFLFSLCSARLIPNYRRKEELFKSGTA